MTVKIIGALLLIGFFFVLSKVGVGMVGRDNPLSKAFPIGSTVIVGFILGLMFLGEL